MLGGLVLVGLALTIATGRGQESTKTADSFSSINLAAAPVQAAVPDSAVQITAEMQGLQCVAYCELPLFGTYWEVMPGGTMAPLPGPCFDPSLPTYAITGNIFLVDASYGQLAVNPRQTATMSTTSATTAALQAEATAVADLIDQVQAASATAAAQSVAMYSGLSDPPSFGDTGTNAYSPDGITNSIFTPNYGTNLWIEEISLASGHLSGIGTNTQTVQYEIQSRTNLAQSDWQSEGFIAGSDLTNWTPLSIAQNGRTNLFIRLKSWGSSDGSGLPDWWELQYFGMTGIDPDALDSAGDGYTIYQKYLLGANPNTWFAPTAPQGVTVNLNQTAQTATVNWLPSAGTVTSYTLQKTDSNDSSPSVQTIHLSATTSSYQDSLTGNAPEPNWPYGGNYAVSYSIMANYANGQTSPWSASIPVQQITVTAYATPGPNGTTALAVSGVPANAADIRLAYIDQDTISGGDTSQDYNVDIPISSFANGAYYMATASFMPTNGDSYAIYAESVDAKGNASGANLFDQSGQGDTELNAGTPFYDGRIQLKQNLIFQLRAAAVDAPFHFSYYQYPYSYPSNYASVGLYDYANGVYYGGFGELLPFEENNFFRNFAFDITEVNIIGKLTNGVYGDNDPPNYYQLADPTFQFNISLPDFQALLATNLTQWLVYDQSSDSDDLESEGVVNGASDGAGNTVFSLRPGKYNWFGLPYTSVNIIVPNSSGTKPVTNIVSAGHSTTIPGNYVVQPNIYAQTAQPGFQTMEYDSWVQINGGYASSPLPGSLAFSPTNQVPPIITSVGNDNLQIACYAKLEVTNSAYNSVYGYLGQYFASAYIIDTNGIVTTNTTGILSPYGNFFATQPGPVALVTMPDPDTGAQGTSIVHCISLNVDKNHDGTIDTTFNGPDITSQTSPMEFWINNDNDGTGVGEDIDAPKIQDSTNEVIQSMRDLEDFARLWICGMPSGDALEGYQVTLSFQNYVGNPSIKLFASHEADGGYGYLTSTNIAQEYVGSPMNDSSLGMVSTNVNYVFPYLRFYNGGTQCLLFEGVSTGEGELVLTITDSNSNTVAQSGVWLDLHDVKDFLEEAFITNNMSGTMSNWTSAIKRVQPAVASGLGNDTNLIVLVHGINVQSWDCLSDAETVYKRLYWSGFQGKFFAVKWPCNLLTPIPSPLTPTVFNLSEFQGYKASQAMITYLTQLRSRFPGTRLNLLVHSQGNSVVSEALSKGAPYDTYILTQGAIPDSSYDIIAQTNAAIADYDFGSHITPDLQPMGYHGAYTNLTGRIVNFYNPYDPVLAIWITDQELEKPSWYFILDTYYDYDGSNSYFYPFTGPAELIADPEESRAMVARSRTLAIGQSGPSSAHGVITSAVNLNTQFGFNDAFPGDHSAQWVWPIQSARPYFQQVLRSCQIIPAP